MDKDISGGKTGDDDVDVDHYFLPRGILDAPSQREEEDMIGGSLLDEIGGVGNVELLPPAQINVSRMVGSGDPQPVREPSVQDLGSRGQQQSHSIREGRPIRLSMEGTNPMAKEFTPSMCPVSPDVIADLAGPGIPLLHSQRLVSDASSTSRVFSAAVGSEIKNATLEQRYRGTLQRQRRKLARPASAGRPLQPPGHDILGVQGQELRQQPGWGSRTTGGQPQARSSIATCSSPSVSVQHRPANQATIQGHRAAPPGPPSRDGVQHLIDRVQAQGHSVMPSVLHRRERVAPGKQYGGTIDQNVDATRESKGRVPLPNAGASPRLVGQPQRRHRTQGEFRQLQPHEEGTPHFRHETHTTSLPATSTARIRHHGEANAGANSLDQGRLSCKGPPANNQIEHGGAARKVQDHTRSDLHGISSKVSSRPPEVTAETYTPADVLHAVTISTENAHAEASSSVPAKPEGTSSSSHADHACATQQNSRGAVFTGRQPVLRSRETPEDEGDRAFVAIAHVDQTSGRWGGSNVERGIHQVVKPEDDSIGQPQSNAHKEKERARNKKKEDKSCRAGPRQLLGASIKETNRARVGTRQSLSQRYGELSSSILGSARVLLTALIRAIVWCLSRLRLFRRLRALLSFAATLGVSILSVVITTSSWLLLMGLRAHSLALREATGSVHVAVCFLFPYFFKYLVSMVDEWAPHWLPACLWYSFLMQMFCTSNHLYQHSISSHLVPAFRALLPVAFLCEVPSGRSYLLALGGSELLLLSFTLAAVRLRCLFSPVFLFSWASQVFAIATFGSSSGLQYCQLLMSLATLHAVSMVDVMLNSRFYHARYRAGMRLTSGFRAIAPLSHKIQ